MFSIIALCLAHRKLAIAEKSKPLATADVHELREPISEFRLAA